MPLYLPDEHECINSVAYRYVGKRYRRGRKAPEVYMQDVVCQMLAGFYVTRFNQALQHCPDDILQVRTV